MTETPRIDEPAREELTTLLPLRDALARRAGALRAAISQAEPARRERLYSRALRCDRLVRLLDTRIRLAAELLASGRITPVDAVESKAS
jgi:hypothetical protein